MPANLTPEYEKAEQRLREATTDEERMEALREMLRVIPKHKGTTRMQGDIKRRISQLRKEAAKKGPVKGVDPYHIPRSGAGQVVLIGTPNVGKSAVAAATTNAPVKVADYPYATALPTPGILDYQDVQIQLIDTPPITAEHVPGGLIGTIRLADIIAVVVDLAGEPLEQLEVILGVLAGRDIQVLTRPRNELPAQDRSRRCGVVVANRIDLAPPGNLDTLRELYAGRMEVLAISALTGEGLDVLCRRLWELLGLIRIYTKQPGKPLDKDRPYTLPVGATVNDLAAAIHRELPEKMKFARIWGDGRYPGQQVHRTETLHDKDVVEIHE